MQNVTDLNQIEQTVQDAREYAENIVDTVREPLIVLDADLKVISANRAFYQTFKTKPEETEGQLVYNIGNQQWNIPKLRKLLEEILPKNTAFDNLQVEHDFHHIGKRTMILNARRIPQPPAKPRIMLLAIEDITKRRKVEEELRKHRNHLEKLVKNRTAKLNKELTERKKAEEELQESESRLRTVVSNIPIVMWAIDQKGVITFSNGLGLKGLGLQPGEIVGQSLFDLYCDAPRVLENHRHALKGEAFRTDIELAGLVFDCWHQPIYNQNGEVTGMIGIASDITERKLAEDKLDVAFQEIKIREKELKMANEHLDGFAYSVSHDLRAPLRAINGFSQVLLDTYGDKVDEEMRHYLDRISEGSKKMGQLIDDLLSFSRSTRGEIKYDQIDVENIVNDLVKAYRDVEQDRDIEFVVNPLGKVEADNEALKVVFTNLLQNAIKFTADREKAHIEIGSEQKEDHIQFYVKDNGIGFDMKYKDKLFEAFQRLRTDEKFTGSGIGLATVERIVSKHGGNIWAEGEVDNGATFYFTLPSKTNVGE